jgi:hypothetical protein
MMGRFADQNMAVWNMFAPRGSEATEEEQTAGASAKTEEATQETAKTGESTKTASSSKSSKA